MIADIAGKLPGRGAWVTADIEIVRKAVTGGKLARHLLNGRNEVLKLGVSVSNVNVKSRSVQRVSNKLLQSVEH